MRTLVDRLLKVVETWNEVAIQDIKIIRTDGGENRLGVAIANHENAIADLPGPENIQESILQEKSLTDEQIEELAILRLKMAKLPPIRTQRDKLIEHIRAHINDSPFSCADCESLLNSIQCPKCGSENLDRTCIGIIVGEGDPNKSNCVDCGWKEK